MDADSVVVGILPGPSEFRDGIPARYTNQSGRLTDIGVKLLLPRDSR